MPEGPEIHRVADRLAAAVLHQRLRTAWFAFPRLQPFQERLRGRRITAIKARGKALLTSFDNGWTMYSHNQLYGVWKVAAAGERPPTRRSLRVALETAESAILLYSASDVEMWRSDALDRHPFLARLGPDVLDPAVDAAAVAVRLRSAAFARRQLGALLLDQGFLAGLGNYLRAEILWTARLPPTRRPCDLQATQLATLAAACLDIPRCSYATRGVEARPGMHAGYQAQAEAGVEAVFRFHVFKRAGEPCERCGTPIEKQSVNARPLFCCPRCQGL